MFGDRPDWRRYREVYTHVNKILEKQFPTMRKIFMVTDDDSNKKKEAEGNNSGKN